MNGTDFLDKLRGKKLVFVGDSINRNMWESLVCILRHSLKDKKRVYEISGRREFKKKGFYAFRFEVRYRFSCGMCSTILKAVTMHVCLMILGSFTCSCRTIIARWISLARPFL